MKTPWETKLPSTTQCLGRYVDLQHIPPERLRIATARGSKIHDYIFMDLADLWVPPALITPEIEGYWESYLIFKNQMIEETIFVEKELICETYGFVGHLDWCGILVGQKEGVSVVDWKSPVQEGRTWKAQLCAYAHLVDEHSDIGLPVTRLGSLMLSPKGKTPKWNGYTKERAYYFNAFLNALGAYKVFTGDS